MRLATAGFTLIEMLVTVSILLVMAMIGTASYTSIVTSTRMQGEISGMLNGLKMARSEAIKRGQTVSFCPQGAGASCGASWAAGWNVLLVGPPAQQLQVGAPVTHGDTLTSTAASYPQFTPAGYTFFSGTLTLHDAASTPGMYHCIVFNAGSWTTQQGAACP